MRAARLVLAGAAVGVGALLGPAAALADPELPPGPAEPPPAGPVVDGEPGPPPAPPPGPPPVPQIANPVSGSGDGPLGFLRDAWHIAKNPFGGPALPGQPAYAPPPPGAGPAPPLPPGYTSITAPESSSPATERESGGPPLPPGYYPITGPPPPGYFDDPPPAA